MNAAAHPRVARDPQIMMGKPTIAGTRVTVEAVVRQFAAGADMGWVLKGFPDLTEEDVRAALAYAAECVSETPTIAAEQMRFAIDACVPAQLADALTALGADVVSGAGRPGMPDEEVLGGALARDRVLITADKDFGELVFRRGQAAIGVVLLEKDSQRVRPMPSQAQSRRRLLVRMLFYAGANRGLHADQLSENRFAGEGAQA